MSACPAQPSSARKSGAQPVDLKYSCSQALLGTLFQAMLGRSQVQLPGRTSALWIRSKRSGSQVQPAPQEASAVPTPA